MIFYIHTYVYNYMYAKQKHPRYKKSEAKLEAPVSSYSYTWLKMWYLVEAKAQAVC